jgi:Tfp pilus assembly protein PilF
VAPAGTSTELRTPAPAPAPKPAPQVVAYAPPLPTPSLQPASDALIKQAEQQRQARDYVGAAATLERALGIQPQEPYVWNRLARVRMEQGLYAQAGNLASRSNDLAGNQSALKQDNWGIIAAARRAAGDTAGAVEAEKKAHGG